MYKIESNLCEPRFAYITIMKVKHLLHVLKSAIHGRVRTPLGRWNVDNYKQTTLKIQYANEDNCGACGEYNDNNTKQMPANYESNLGLKDENENDDDDELYVYMMGLDTVPSVLYARHK
jgi:hypothetical protein